MFKVGDIVKQRDDNYSKWSYGYVRSNLRKRHGFGQVTTYKQGKLCLILDIKQYESSSPEIMFFVDNKILYANSMVFEHV
jgi:hypothetical protein